MKESQTPDMLLIERFQRGDESALDLLVQRHQNRAYQLAFRLARDPEVASDVVADAFARMYRSVGRFKGQCAFTTWLHKIVTNCFLDYRKRTLARPVVSINSVPVAEDGEFEPHFSAPGADPFDLTVQAEQNRAIGKAISKLSRPHRLLIVMFHTEMLSYDEISNKLGLPLGTVKSRLNRARLALREILTPEPAFQA